MSKEVVLLATGGTVSSALTGDGVRPTLAADDLVEGLPLQSIDVEVRTKDFESMPSRAMSPSHMFALAQLVQAEADRGARGVVITHGTDTIEETAYVLAMLLDVDVPVILTGAMRASSELSSDGPANLFAAICAAADERLSSYGPVVVHQDEIHLARLVTKFHSTRVAAFASPQAGPVGILVENTVRLFMAPPAGSERLRAAAPPSKRVELIWAVSGADGLVVKAIAGLVDGLVFAGTGGGHAAPALAEELVRVAQSGLPVVLTSRCGSGQVLSDSYGGIGSERHLLRGGLYSAGDLQPVKARLRLMFGLSAGIAPDELFRDQTHPGG